MSTRAHLIIRNGDKKVYVYHHCDGYPAGVGEDVRQFINENGKDIFSPAEFAIDLNTWSCDYEVENIGLHGDEDYVYDIDLKNKTYTCYNTHKNNNGVKWCDITEPEVYHCDKCFEESF